MRQPPRGSIARRVTCRGSSAAWQSLPKATRPASAPMAKTPDIRNDAEIAGTPRVRVKVHGCDTCVAAAKPTSELGKARSRSPPARSCPATGGPGGRVELYNLSAATVTYAPSCQLSRHLSRGDVFSKVKKLATVLNRSAACSVEQDGHVAATKATASRFSVCSSFLSWVSTLKHHPGAEPSTP